MLVPISLISCLENILNFRLIMTPFLFLRCILFLVAHSSNHDIHLTCSPSMSHTSALVASARTLDSLDLSTISQLSFPQCSLSCGTGILTSDYQRAIRALVRS